MLKTRSTFIPSIVLFFFGAGCGVFNADDGAPPAADPANDPPTAPPLRGTPAPSELDESLGVFVVAGASDAGDGTRVHPFGTITKGIATAKAAGKRVYVCAGVYREAIVVADGVSIVGGLDCTTAAWSIGSGRSRIEAPTSPAITAKGIAGTTRFERFEVVAPDASEPGATSIGLFAREAPGLVVADSRIVAGNGAKGPDGAPGVQLVQKGRVDGEAGLPEGDHCEGVDPRFCSSVVVARTGGGGGVSVCSGEPGHDAESGGTGGTSGVYQGEWSGIAVREIWALYAHDAKYDSGPGEARAGGVALDGTNGASATSPGKLTKEGFVPSDGTRGTGGAPGKGGSGGHGEMPVAAPIDGAVWFGNAGSGGGAGGCPGLAGGEGKGGGASIAALVVDGAMTFDGAELVSKNGGAGGKGSFGSDPTPGGNGGPLVNHAGTAGSPGTSGGKSGVSGSGAGGSSFALVFTGGAPAKNATKTTAGVPGDGVPAMTANGKTIPASAPGEAKEIYEL